MQNVTLSTVWGGSQDDFITLTDALNSNILAEGGNDFIIASDCISTNNALFYVLGHADNDTMILTNIVRASIEGGPGCNLIQGSNVILSNVFGGADNDTIAFSNISNSFIYGGAGNNSITINGTDIVVWRYASEVAPDGSVETNVITTPVETGYLVVFDQSNTINIITSESKNNITTNIWETYGSGTFTTAAGNYYILGGTNNTFNVAASSTSVRIFSFNQQNDTFNPPCKISHTSDLKETATILSPPNPNPEPTGAKIISCVVKYAECSKGQTIFNNISCCSLPFATCTITYTQAPTPTRTRTHTHVSSPTSTIAHTHTSSLTGTITHTHAISPTKTETHTITLPPTYTHTPIPTSTRHDTPTTSSTHTHTPIPTRTKPDTPTDSSTQTYTPIPTSTTTCYRPTTNFSLKPVQTSLMLCSKNQVWHNNFGYTEIATAFSKDLYNLMNVTQRLQIPGGNSTDLVGGQFCKSAILQFLFHGKAAYNTNCTSADFKNLNALSVQWVCNVVSELCTKESCPEAACYQKYFNSIKICQQSNFSLPPSTGWQEQNTCTYELLYLCQTNSTLSCTAQDFSMLAPLSAQLVAQDICTPCSSVACTNIYGFYRKYFNSIKICQRENFPFPNGWQGNCINGLWNLGQTNSTLNCTAQDFSMLAPLSAQLVAQDICTPCSSVACTNIYGFYRKYFNSIKICQRENFPFPNGWQGNCINGLWNLGQTNSTLNCTAQDFSMLAPLSAQLVAQDICTPCSSVACTNIYGFYRKYFNSIKICQRENFSFPNGWQCIDGLWNLGQTNSTLNCTAQDFPTLAPLSAQLVARDICTPCSSVACTNIYGFYRKYFNSIKICQRENFSFPNGWQCIDGLWDLGQTNSTLNCTAQDFPMLAPLSAQLVARDICTPCSSAACTNIYGFYLKYFNSIKICQQEGFPFPNGWQCIDGLWRLGQTNSTLNCTAQDFPTLVPSSAQLVAQDICTPCPSSECANTSGFYQKYFNSIKICQQVGFSLPPSSGWQGQGNCIDGLWRLGQTNGTLNCTAQDFSMLAPLSAQLVGEDICKTF